ncbi:MAG: hypothetical protein RLZZ219_1074 [Cyanobacteriota bacterium]
MLVEPAGPLNVGSVARLCANFGIAELRLVAPRCDHRGPEARQMAVHAGPLLEQAGIYADLAAALADCRRVVATSGRIEPEDLPLAPVGEALAWLQAAGGGAAGPDGTAVAPGALVFGREDRGLSNDELRMAGRVVRLSTDPAYSSLNLSHAVAICLHELRRPAPRPVAAPVAASKAPAAEGGEPCARGPLEDALADAEALLLEVGFLHPHTAHARMAKLRALLQRAQVTDPEVALLRGMVRQLRWASQRRTP